MRKRLLPIALVLAVIVMVYLAAQVGRQSAEITQNAERIEALTASPVPEDPL